MKKNKYFRITSKHIRIVFFIVAILSFESSYSQDAQFSQYYRAPLYLNPGFVGINQQGSMGFNYRNQWPGIQARFETASLYVDHYFEESSNSLGFITTLDREGLVGLRSISIGLQYAYQFQFTSKIMFRPGVEVSYKLRDINFSQLTFGDQFTQNGLVNPISTENLNTGDKAQFVDIALGGVLYTPKMWFGVAVHHITEPNQSLTNGTAPLPRRYSAHGGYKFSLIKDPVLLDRMGERSITPTFSYRAQGQFDQLDLGTYFTIQPIIFGFWYRGIPVSSVKNVKNIESIITMLAYQHEKYIVGYSFDFILSDLGMDTGGAHEISFTYSINFTPNKLPLSVMKLPCPVPFMN